MSFATAPLHPTTTPPVGPDPELRLFQVQSPLGATALVLSDGPAGACALAREIDHGPDGRPFDLPEEHMSVCLLEVELDVAGVIWWA